mmetsp:Transcript_2934/g.7893  ORF Transcript_2934/g.7893 Transcript_2934/m.7893 type:complete len:376 (-) Transcript_2934:40-1167(-)
MKRAASERCTPSRGAHARPGTTRLHRPASAPDQAACAGCRSKGSSRRRSRNSGCSHSRPVVSTTWKMLQKAPDCVASLRPMSAAALSTSWRPSCPTDFQQGPSQGPHASGSAPCLSSSVTTSTSPLTAATDNGQHLRDRGQRLARRQWLMSEKRCSWRNLSTTPFSTPHSMRSSPELHCMSDEDLSEVVDGIDRSGVHGGRLPFVETLPEGHPRDCGVRDGADLEGAGLGGVACSGGGPGRDGASSDRGARGWTPPTSSSSEAGAGAQQRRCHQEEAPLDQAVDEARDGVEHEHHEAAVLGAPVARWEVFRGTVMRESARPTPAEARLAPRASGQATTTRVWPVPVEQALFPDWTLEGLFFAVSARTSGARSIAP